MTELLLSIFQIPFLLVGIILGLYLLLLTFAPLLVPRKKKTVAATKKKFAIIIPAHNEEKVIDGTLRSALQIDYPRELFDVIVVADNCTDQTAKIALSCGAIVFQRTDTTKRGKGYALNWIIPQVLERLPAPGYDACVFIDADSVVSRNFLEEMNISLNEGHRIIQSSDLVLDNSNAWRVQMMLIAFALQNYARPLGKSLLGFSTPLKGNGMCFSTVVLGKLKWNESSLGEDLDMGLELILQGERIHFNPDPVAYAIMPEHASGAETQRARWEGGRFASMRLRVPALLQEAWRKKSLHLLEAAMDAVFPPLAILLLAVGLFVLANSIFTLLGLAMSKYVSWGWYLVFAMMIVHCVVGLMIAKVHPRSLLAFLYVPRYLVWKIRVYMSMLLGKTSRAWVRTER